MYIACIVFARIERNASAIIIADNTHRLSTQHCVNVQIKDDREKYAEACTSGKYTRKCKPCVDGKIVSFKGLCNHFYSARCIQRTNAREALQEAVRAENHRVKSASREVEIQRIERGDPLTVLSFSFAGQILKNSNVMTQAKLENDGDRKFSIERHHRGHHAFRIMLEDKISMVHLVDRKVSLYANGGASTSDFTQAV